MLAQRISMVNGVSRVMVYGAQKYAVRVQVDPDQLAAHNIGIDEVRRGHRDAATPTCRPARLDGDKQAFTIQSNGSCRTRRLSGRSSSPGGTARRCGWTRSANVIDGVDNDKLAAWYNDKRAVILAIQKQPGTNTVEVVDSIREAAAGVPPRHSADRPPDGRVRRVGVRSAAPSATWSSRWF